MMAAGILWSHAFAGLLFGLLAVMQARHPAGTWPRAAFVAALGLSALCALAVSGIGAGDVSTRIAESARNIAWLGFMFALARRDRAATLALSAVYVAVIATAVIAAGMAVVTLVPMPDSALAALDSARLVFGMMVAVSALVLVNHLYQAHAAAAAGAGRIRLVLIALGVLWTVDLVTFGVSLIGTTQAGAVMLTRGLVMIGVALALLVAVNRSGDAPLALSRPIATRSLGAIALILYGGMTLVATQVADSYAGPYARLVQTAIICGSTAALLTLLATPWLRAWTQVTVAKHLFRHRYDYRAEWQRFTDTLGSPGRTAETLECRVIKAVADITASPAGLLLVADGDRDGALRTATGWNWAHGGHDADPDAAVALDLHERAHIVELDSIRNGSAPDDTRSRIPGWLLARREAWAIVPLVHGGAMVGAIVLARPPVDRSLDWEDFDLLRVAGRQAASYLAEDRAHSALADAQRFDEFNRRFAFILHDIKNLVSQLSLVARNAERHADNPEFRVDMIATLKESADRMNILLARLSQHHVTRDEPVQPIEVGALIERVAATHRLLHPVTTRVSAATFATAQAGRLEQVLGHLVQNAIEASAAGDAVLLSVETAGRSVVVDVVDHGCGMSAGFVRDQLFKPFVSSKPTGFGIGACEALQLVREMRGTLEVNSHEGEGTRFRIRLPIADVMEVAA